MNLLFALTRRAARILGDDYDAEVVEMHHRFKKDAPSGTAARLLEIILEERKLGAGRAPPRPQRHHRRAHRDARSAFIRCAAATSSAITRSFSRRLGERLELTHKASDRRDLRPRRPAGGPVGRRAAARRLRHAGRARARAEAMITSIQGTLASASPLRAVVELNGLGYEVNIPATTAERLPAARRQVKLHTLVIYREDAQTLYGFATPAERDFFRLMIENVTGVGPKVALGIMSRLSLPLLEGAIRAGDIATAGQCPGIGRKTAERLVVELKVAGRGAAGASAGGTMPRRGRGRRMPVRIAMPWRPWSPSATRRRMPTRRSAGPRWRWGRRHDRGADQEGAGRLEPAATGGHARPVSSGTERRRLDATLRCRSGRSAACAEVAADSDRTRGSLGTRWTGAS